MLLFGDTVVFGLLLSLVSVLGEDHCEKTKGETACRQEDGAIEDPADKYKKIGKWILKGTQSIALYKEWFIPTTEKVKICFEIEFLIQIMDNEATEKNIGMHSFMATFQSSLVEIF
ncbi:hypothetical protein WA026_022321 [Henosepilachna vigintioctopunctata]|uniref:Uncharacterized protein n=1 Tax=Henosepilachna vigintioctopunctata TaxID=420089 RepID=A0AAW1V1Z9_9CUCU